MNRIVCASLAGVLLTGTVAAAQSLGDIARKQRQQKKPAAARVVTNDDLATATTFNNGAASTGIEEKPADAADKKATDSTLPSPEEKARLAAEWRAKLDEQRNAVALLEREVDVFQREYKLRVTAYYADAGYRFRDQRTWGEQDRKYQDEIAAKQKNLADARQKLEDMQEQARKAGTPTAQID